VILKYTKGFLDNFRTILQCRLGHPIQQMDNNLVEIGEVIAATCLGRNAVVKLDSNSVTFTNMFKKALENNGFKVAYKKKNN